jgi:hypothetical protein
MEQVRVEGRAATLAAIGFTLALALWVGGSALYTFVLTPAIFRGYPRDAAGAIVGAMMPGYFTANLAAAAAALALLPLLWRSWTPRLRALALALLLVALAAQAWVRWGLYPEILAVKGRVASFEAAPDSPDRVRFRKLHGVSMAVNLATLLEGAALLALVPLRRRREA